MKEVGVEVCQSLSTIHNVQGALVDVDDEAMMMIIMMRTMMMITIKIMLIIGKILNPIV